MKFIIFIVFFLTINQTCSVPKYNAENMETVMTLDVQKYMGKWYEIYRLPMRAEKDLVNVTATYSLREDGRINVLNEGYKYSPDGKHKKAKALAWRPNENIPGALIVRFFWIIKSSYLVLELDSDYQWAIVSTKDRSFAWILARKPLIPSDLEQKLLEKAKSHNIDTSRFIKTMQQWD